MTKRAHLNERERRGSEHVALAITDGQSLEDGLASALADLRAWAAAEGVPFAKAVEKSRTQYIHSHVTKER